MMARSRLAVLALTGLMAVCSVTWFARHAPDDESSRSASPAHLSGMASLPGRIDFQQDIQPLLAAHCYACHGPAAQDGEQGTWLRLDQRDEVVGSVIVPGNADRSRLVARLTSSNPRKVMPPPGRNRSALTAAQLDLVRRWINEGAAYQQHWAFTPLRRPPVPSVSGGSRWVRNPIDAFVLEQLQRQGLRLSPEADRRTLLRRLSLDLLGLPPTPEDVAAFVASTAPDAYERQVDRLLASPHFGERLAVLWLDLVRYADTDGYSKDQHRDVWLYRDYVITSFNRNKPFDRFTLQQLAGDLLPDAGPEDRVAAGYNRLLMTAREGCADPKEYRHRYAVDRVRNLASVWLGVTLGCAECHDHKFDPFPARDFYRLAAFFADIQEPGVGAVESTRSGEPAREAETQAIDRHRNIPTSLVVTSGTPRITRVRPRGNWADDSGPVVEPGLPAALAGPAPAPRRLTRLDLARWLVAPDNPLVARVLVNRLWQLAFGRALVATPDDFGSRGVPPSHPELLDWLAAEFLASGWDVKHVLRLLVTSSTYRQTSHADGDLRRLDPDNRWLGRQNQFRLEAEFIRDNALTIAGLLTPRLGGRSVKPYQPKGYWGSRFTDKDYQPSPGEDQYRRGLYTYWCRGYLHPSLLAFDASCRQSGSSSRDRSSLPQQALALLNDPTHAEAARAFAARILREGGAATETRLDRAFQLAQSRSVTSGEAAVLTALLKKHHAEYQADRSAAAAVLQVGASPVPAETDMVELAAWTSVARVILNLHDTSTRK